MGPSDNFTNKGNAQWGRQRRCARGNAAGCLGR
jgi:hypothetical protein